MASSPRKKQPEQVRLRLLQATAEIAAQSGLEAVTTAEVAKRAGVTSGGLFHHFASKKDLIDELLNSFMDSFEAHLEQLIKQDPDPRGRFCRAYLLGSQSFEHPLYEASLQEPVYMEMSRNAELSKRWLAWLDKQLAKHGPEKDPVLGAIIRYATDGLCVEDYSSIPVNPEDRRAVVDRLVEWTRQL